MFQASQRPARPRRHRTAVTCLIAVFWLAAAPHAAPSQSKERDGMFVSVPHPITEGVVNQIQTKIRDAILRQKRPIQTIVFDFTPDGQPAASDNFGLCLNLRDYILSLRENRADPAYPRDIKTVAFVHGPVSRHTVLPVLACSQIVMSSEASIGKVRADGEVLKEHMRDAYEQTGRARGLADVVGKMLDGKRFATADARAAGLSKEVYETRKQLADALYLSPRSLREDWLAGRRVVAAKVELNGPATAGNLESVERRVKDMINRGHNLIILWLDSEGGNATSNAALLQEYLATRKDRTHGLPIKVIAYVPPNRALGVATFLALGASEIVMGSNSSLGDFSYFTHPNPEAATALAQMAEKQGYPPALFRATLDPSTVVYRVRTRDAARAVGFITSEEWEADQKSPRPRWSEKTELTGKSGAPFKITAELAREAGIAVYTDVDSLQELCSRYDIDHEQVTVSRGDFLDGVAEFFRSPLVKLLLLLVGITGLILELKMPGFGVPGIVAALCFVLFFWSHSFVNEYTALAVLLFLLGLVLLGIEIFILPGFGITGISGILLLIISLLLVTLKKIPESPQEFESLGWTLASLVLSIVGAIVAALAIASFLPQIPYANRLLLAPPDDTADGEQVEPTAATAEANAALLGAIGIAETPLRPAGKARFGDDYIDVVSEGDYIVPGSRVQVVEVEGNRIVVKQV